MLSGAAPQRCVDEAQTARPRSHRRRRGTRGAVYSCNMKEYCVYILLCSDDSYYTGVTNNMEQRLQQHQEGVDVKAFTFRRRPVKLVYQHDFREVTDAIAAEKQIQGWSRKKKEALIAGKFALLHTLAMSTEKKEKIARVHTHLQEDASSAPFDSSAKADSLRTPLSMTQ